ncbi:peroxidase [Sphingomonas sp. BK580]|uniref:Dyp-type peroxidase n=1 Tax=Sphingomonas sp. BK580 TaxID=2586972 RepID=UPI0016147870|nr:peroxidase [Sphingomonas sp. BK580]MBB3693580.1 Dyp-type peroxidase family [Sphingomonas sp. BK580]
MSFKLEGTLRWTKASEPEIAALKDLQGNILDGHGRKATRHVFLRFGSNAEEARAFVREYAEQVTSAFRQLTEAQRFRAHGVSGPPFIGLLLSSSGYAALGASEKAPQPDDKGAFAEGMLARSGLLADPEPDQLDEPYRQRIDAMVLIGGNPDAPDSWESTEAENAETRLLNIMRGRAEVVATEIGRAIFRDNGEDESGIHKIEGIEHFGYVDGRSQPLMLDELIERERDESDGISVWDPTFPIGQVLVPDPGSPAPDTAFGSFFVFRKLEQDVAGFKAREEELGKSVDLGAQGELMVATLVGRFEDGTPVVLQRDGGGDNPVMNNFDYAGDPDGLRCPLHAHIRKTNPRGDSVRQFGVSLEEERSHIMARRGMTYGRRDRVVDPSDAPSGGVGLMFMAFYRNLATGFEFTQASWANNPGFVRPGTGRDPIIGRRGNKAPEELTIRKTWGKRDAEVAKTGFDEFVRHKGGEYFFAPSISTLLAL